MLQMAAAGPLHGRAAFRWIYAPSLLLSVLKVYKPCFLVDVVIYSPNLPKDGETEAQRMTFKRCGHRAREQCRTVLIALESNNQGEKQETRSSNQALVPEPSPFMPWSGTAHSRCSINMNGIEASLSEILFSPSLFSPPSPLSSAEGGGMPSGTEAAQLSFIS